MASHEIKKHKNIKEIKKRIALFQTIIHLGVTVDNNPQILQLYKLDERIFIQTFKKISFYGELMMNEGNAPTSAEKN